MFFIRGIDLELFVIWFCLLLFNIGIIFYDKIKKLKILFIICAIIIVNYIFAITFIYIYENFINKYLYIEYELKNMSIFTHYIIYYQDLVKIVFITGNWVLPLIYFIWKSKRN
jgi:hypothetical protein